VQALRPNASEDAVLAAGDFTPATMSERFPILLKRRYDLFFEHRFGAKGVFEVLDNFLHRQSELTSKRFEVGTLSEPML
jgi:hypothetical protein